MKRLTAAAIAVAATLMITSALIQPAAAVPSGQSPSLFDSRDTNDSRPMGNSAGLLIHIKFPKNG